MRLAAETGRKAETNCRVETVALAPTVIPVSGTPVRTASVHSRETATGAVAGVVSALAETVSPTSLAMCPTAASVFAKIAGFAVRVGAGLAKPSTG